MKKFGILALTALALAFTSCASVKVDRVDSNKVVDLDGYWNDTDVRIVCESLIKDCTSSPRIARFETLNKRSPIVIIGSIKNDSDEHIDTGIIAKRFQNAIINNGVMEFVSSKDERGELRDEISDQADHASESTAKAIDNETGADYMLLGSVKSIVQSSGKDSVRTYFVTAQLHDLETHKIIWSGENDEIKKVIKRSSVKF